MNHQEGALPKLLKHLMVDEESDEARGAHRDGRREENGPATTMDDPTSEGNQEEERDVRLTHHEQKRSPGEPVLPASSEDAEQDRTHQHEYGVLAEHEQHKRRAKDEWQDCRDDGRSLVYLAANGVGAPSKNYNTGD